MAEEWTYRYLAAAHAWAVTEAAAIWRIGVTDTVTDQAVRGARPAPKIAEVRAWARANGLAVSDRGRLRPEVYQAWYEAHPP